MMSLQQLDASSQMNTDGPAISFLTSCWLLPRKRVERLVDRRCFIRSCPSLQAAAAAGLKARAMDRKKTSGHEALYWVLANKSHTGEEADRRAVGDSSATSAVELCTTSSARKAPRTKGGKPSKSDLPTPREICGVSGRVP